MSCKTCDALVATFERSVRLYSNAVRQICGTVGNDFVLALNKAEELRVVCQEISDDISVHCQKEHLALRKG